MPSEKKLIGKNLAENKLSKNTLTENKLIENSSEKDFEVPPFNKEALMDNETAWENFDKLADSYRKNYIRWAR